MDFLEIKEPTSYDSDDRSDFAIELKEDKDQEGVFIGHASVFNKRDLQDEIVEPGAFKRTLNRKKGKFPLLWQHDKSEPIGMIEAEEDGRGLKVKGTLALGVQRAKDALELLRAKIVTGMSIGFRVVKDNIDPDKGTRNLKEVDLWEVSLVTFPANPAAQVRRVKSVTPFQNLPMASGDIAWDSSAAKKRIREWSDSADGPTAKYKRAFLWYDKEDDQNFGAYKLPYADIIDGDLKAVPRGVYAAAAAIQGARGGVEIPSGDKKAVRGHLDRYYSKLDRTPPWSSMVSIDDQIRSLLDLIEHCDDAHLDDLRSALDTTQTRALEPFDWIKSDESSEPDPTGDDVEDIKSSFSFLDEFIPLEKSDDDE
jgi:HK97 family phage prohead protease|tara:strand:+ start:3432 stop:4532 length:1101 start_codon:yes stop_codon:yes gene_type:complete